MLNQSLDEILTLIENSPDKNAVEFSQRFYAEYGSFEQINKVEEELEDYQDRLERSEATVEDLTTRLTEEWEVTKNLRVRLCDACNIIQDARYDKFPERFKAIHEFGPDYEWVTINLAQFKHLAPDMEHLIAGYTRGNEVWLKQGGESLYERVQ